MMANNCGDLDYIQIIKLEPGYENKNQDIYYFNNAFQCDLDVSDELTPTCNSTHLGNICYGDTNHPQKIGLEFDSEYDSQANLIIDEVLELLENDSFLHLICSEESHDVRELERSLLNRNEKEIASNSTSQLQHDDEEVPEWYSILLEKKLNIAKVRLASLYQLAICFDGSIKENFRSIKDVNDTLFCELDPPRYYVLEESWTNSWKFMCTKACNNESKTHLQHTQDCQIVIMQAVSSNNVLPIETIQKYTNEYPKLILKVVEEFENFINNLSYNDVQDLCTKERSEWDHLLVQSNEKQEMMLIICGDISTLILQKLKTYFLKVEKLKQLNITSLYYKNKNRQGDDDDSIKLLMGNKTITANIASIQVQYFPGRIYNSKSIEILEDTISEYLFLTSDMCILNFGVDIALLSQILAKKCNKLLGFTTSSYETLEAKRMSLMNDIYNTEFIEKQPNDINEKTLKFVQNYEVVVIINQNSPYGNNGILIKKLRAIKNVTKIVVYGSFEDEYKSLINLLSKEEKLGEPFVPIQGCIVDKSVVTIENFDIVILFERKSVNEKLSSNIFKTSPKKYSSCEKLCKEGFKVESTEKIDPKMNSTFIPECNASFSKNFPSMSFDKDSDGVINIKPEPDYCKSEQFDADSKDIKNLKIKKEQINDDYEEKGRGTFINSFSPCSPFSKKLEKFDKQNIYNSEYVAVKNEEPDIMKNGHKEENNNKTIQTIASQIKKILDDKWALYEHPKKKHSEKLFKDGTKLQDNSNLLYGNLQNNTDSSIFKNHSVENCEQKKNYNYEAENDEPPMNRRSIKFNLNNPRKEINISHKTTKKLPTLEAENILKLEKRKKKLKELLKMDQTVNSPDDEVEVGESTSSKTTDSEHTSIKKNKGRTKSPIIYRESPKINNRYHWYANESILHSRFSKTNNSDRSRYLFHYNKDFRPRNNHTNYRSISRSSSSRYHRYYSPTTKGTSKSNSRSRSKSRSRSRTRPQLKESHKSRSKYQDSTLIKSKKSRRSRSSSESSKSSESSDSSSSSSSSSSASSTTSKNHSSKSKNKEHFKTKKRKV